MEISRLSVALGAKLENDFADYSRLDYWDAEDVLANIAGSRISERDAEGRSLIREYIQQHHAPDA